jgi:hypothetical protein
VEILAIAKCPFCELEVAVDLEQQKIFFRKKRCKHAAFVSANVRKHGAPEGRNHFGDEWVHQSFLVASRGKTSTDLSALLRTLPQKPQDNKTYAIVQYETNPSAADSDGVEVSAFSVFAQDPIGFLNLLATQNPLSGSI